MQSQIFAENKVFMAGAVAPGSFISRFNGTAIFAFGTLVNGHSRHDPVDVVGGSNDQSPSVLSSDQNTLESRYWN